MKALEADPSGNLDAVTKFMQEICHHNDITSDFVKSTILAQDCALVTSLINLTQTKSIAQEAIRLLDEVCHHPDGFFQLVFSISLKLSWQIKPMMPFTPKQQNIYRHNEPVSSKC